jgi:hypothetical protein
MRIYILLSAIFLIACGEPQGMRPEFTESYVDNSIGTPQILEFSEGICDDSQTYKINLFRSFNNFQTNNYTPANIGDDLTLNTNTNTGLRKKLLFKGEIIDRVTLNLKNNQIITKRVTKKKAITPNLCVGKDFTQEEQYLDEVGVKVDFVLNLVAQAIKNTRLNSLKPINVRIHPTFKKEEVVIGTNHKRTESMTLINNALFNYVQNEMMILPQGENSQGIIPFNGTPLWDVPLVIAHEYGHYVFSQLYPNYFKTVAPHKISRAHLCYNNEGIKLIHNHTASNTGDDEAKDKDKKEAEKKTAEPAKPAFNFEVKEIKPKRNSRKAHSIAETSRGGKNTVEEESSFFRSVDKNTIIGAFNEGFADLFARYTLDDQYTVNGLGCLTSTRDVYSDKFLSGEQKIFGNQVIKTFLATIKLDKKSCFEQANYQSLHVVGSIFAFGVDKLYTELGLSKENKLKQIILWVRSINRAHNYIQSLDNQAAMKYYILLAFENMMDQYPQNQVKIKEVFERIFPIVADEFTL